MRPKLNDKKGTHQFHIQFTDEKITNLTFNKKTEKRQRIRVKLKNAPRGISLRWTPETNKKVFQLEFRFRGKKIRHDCGVFTPGVYTCNSLMAYLVKLNEKHMDTEGNYKTNPNVDVITKKQLKQSQLKTCRETIELLHIKKKNLIIVIGGDGFMLQTLKKNKNSKKQFYGINSGNYGFLMNKFSSKNIIKNLSKANMVSISPLEMIVKNKNNQIRKSIAINEVSILRQSRQAASLYIRQGSRQIIKKLVSDGVLVSTPAGSTAYNLSVHGPILSLHSRKLSISPISAFRPRRWKGKIVNDKTKIIITNLNPSKRPISAVADNSEVRNAKSVTVKTNNKIKFNLLYDKNRSLQKKIKIEQIRKETN